MKPSNTAYLAHIRDAIQQIEQYSSGRTYDQYINSAWDQAAIARNLEIIGEAASQLSEEYKEAHREIPWRKISDFRNVLTHEYFAIDPLLVWEIMQKNLPDLKKQIERLLVHAKESSS